ncbi:Pimeloyl-ACP methyl ester carboxylesterase [Micromonospora sediminicola]|uniref:Pimeloyl-ACP methyl ester carboxylesterase n=1 Tax=Micromonospora sediminicola TaxID=946078 RepID=A0A1A9BD26_9ACTN|nr:MULTISPECIES: alpha/beta fold hydrolase [Micromonospora]PGH45205.1 alpha/beta hydrolase [Micromonospora sp. WMMA1996]SBT67073.1 Pimeloyl-ACP methyl ester carboxylesterase [Micromonospora sediminicola]
MSAPVEVVFERRGAGPALVLLHGIGHHWGAWLPVLDRLAETHDVIAVDLPGFGRSPVPTTGLPADMPGLVAGMVELFAALGLERPHVAGNSLGGAIALELAAAGAVSSATALSPAGFCTPRELRWALTVLTLHRNAARLPEPVLRHLFAAPALRALAMGMILARPNRMALDVALADARALRQARAFRAVARAGRGYAFAGAPTVPVTVAWGTRDRILPYRQAALARTRLPAARHLDLPGCGHVPMHDDPDLVTSVILDTTGVRPA